MRFFRLIFLFTFCASPLPLVAQESPMIGTFRITAVRDTSLDTDFETCREFWAQNPQSLDIVVTIEPFDGETVLFSSQPSTQGVRGLGQTSSFDTRVGRTSVAFTRTFLPEKIFGGLALTLNGSSPNSGYEALYEFLKEIGDVTCRLRLSGVATKDAG